METLSASTILLSVSTMQASAGLVAGSHNRNELVVIHGHEEVPEMYFSDKIDYLKDKVQPIFVKERRAMKREYEEFKVPINALVVKSMKAPAEGWIMQDGTPWPGNNTKDHPGMIQVFLGQNGRTDFEGNELPRLVYVSREKRPGFQHHKKAGAMNARFQAL